ncbi:uncharacterized protein LOC129600751 [Paramacrobiotus metropolitanus]|uniref:uncharacterized protein LOC129600751 n=1 Tax=Paramacrobiotus metropolitanus TaxID=2943436 RepID=UPI00244574E8|nr:uncharacterized protein LOC129600751 [Paramacrobiotus metropolitanus]
MEAWYAVMLAMNSAIVTLSFIAITTIVCNFNRAAQEILDGLNSLSPRLSLLSVAELLPLVSQFEMQLETLGGIHEDMETSVGLPLLLISASTFYSLTSTVAQMMVETDTPRHPLFWAYFGAHNLLHLSMMITLIVLVDRATNKNNNIAKISRRLLGDCIRLRQEEVHKPTQTTEDEPMATGQSTSSTTDKSVAATGVPSRKGLPSVMKRVVTAAKSHCHMEFYAFRMVSVERVMIITVLGLVALAALFFWDRREGFAGGGCPALTGNQTGVQANSTATMDV